MSAQGPTAKDALAELQLEKCARSSLFPAMIRDGRLRAEDAAQRTAALDLAIHIVRAVVEDGDQPTEVPVPLWGLT